MIGELYFLNYENYKNNKNIYVLLHYKYSK